MSKQLLKRIEEVDKNLPPRCRHRWPGVVLDAESKAEADRVQREIQNCANCRGDTKALFFIILDRRHLAQHEGNGEQGENGGF